MRHTLHEKMVGLALAASAIFSSVRAAEVTIQLPPELNAFKQDVGAEIANAQCLICHSAEYVTTQPPFPRAFWKGSVEKMQQKYGAMIPEAQVEPLVDYLVKNYGLHTNGIAAAAPPVSPVSVALVARSESTDGQKIANKYGCFGCHHVSMKIVGPAYRDIAAKYKTDAAAASKIEQQVHKGGSGKWGPMIMPPFPQVSEAETKILTEWILGLK